MLLQELFTPERANSQNAYGVELNEESTKTEYATPPKNLEAIGFVFKVDAENMIDEALLDIIITYKLTNLSVIMEIPSHMFMKQGIEPKYLLQLASNVDFAISLLPPGHPLVDSSMTNDDYVQVINRFTDELLSRQNFDKEIVPITNFFQYVMLEQLLDKEQMQDFKIQDPYIIENFSSVLSVENSDKFKKEIRAKLYDFYGSEEDFNEVANLMFENLYKRAKNIYTDFIRETISQESTPPPEHPAV